MAEPGRSVITVSRVARRPYLDDLLPHDKFSRQSLPLCSRFTLVPRLVRSDCWWGSRAEKENLTSAGVSVILGLAQFYKPALPRYLLCRANYYSVVVLDGA
jgi:hypothetical protein